ncbi:hypothetical protein GJ496_006046 [Pomphorhynchus laevis]|nr:hypothetical protein GJ496_006046 [Pomphorhynchus laevis]
MNGKNITMHVPGVDVSQYEFDGFTNEYNIVDTHSDLFWRSHGGSIYPKQYVNGPIADHHSEEQFAEVQEAASLFDRDCDGTMATKESMQKNTLYAEL